MKIHYKKQIEILQKAESSMDSLQVRALLDDCLGAIKNGHSIIITALGKNAFIAEKFVATLHSVGIQAAFVHTNSALHGDLGKINKKDVVIILSKSGETDETVYLCQLLHERTEKNWLLTCHENSTCASIIKNTIVLHIENEGDPWNLIPHHSSLLFFVFFQSVAMYLLYELKIPIDVLKSNHPGGYIGKRLKKHHDSE